MPPEPETLIVYRNHTRSARVRNKCHCGILQQRSPGSLYCDAHMALGEYHHVHMGNRILAAVVDEWIKRSGLYGVLYILYNHERMGVVVGVTKTL